MKKRKLEAKIEALQAIADDRLAKIADLRKEVHNLRQPIREEAEKFMILSVNKLIEAHRPAANVQAFHVESFAIKGDGEGNPVGVVEVALEPASEENDDESFPIPR